MAVVDAGGDDHLAVLQLRAEQVADGQTATPQELVRVLAVADDQTHQFPGSG